MRLGALRRSWGSATEHTSNSKVQLGALRAVLVVLVVLMVCVDCVILVVLMVCVVLVVCNSKVQLRPPTFAASVHACC